METVTDQLTATTSTANNIATPTNKRCGVNQLALARIRTSLGIGQKQLQRMKFLVLAALSETNAGGFDDAANRDGDQFVIVSPEPQFRR